MAALQCELCGGKLIGRPGGMFECDSCGMEYDTAWAKQKIQEIKGTVKVEGTVEVTGSVKVEGTANIDGLLKRANIAIQDGKFAEVVPIIDKVMDIDPENEEAHMCLLLAHFQLKSWDKVVEKKWNELPRDEFWTKALRYAKPAKRAKMEAAYERVKTFWTQKDESLKERFLKIQPARGLIQGGALTLLGLKTDGTVYADYDHNRYPWIKQVETWTGIKKVLTPCGGAIIGLRWDGTMCIIVREQEWDADSLNYSAVTPMLSKWQDVVDFDCDSNAIVAVTKQGKLLSVHVPDFDIKKPNREKVRTCYHFNSDGFQNVKSVHLICEYDSDFDRDFDCHNRCYSALGVREDGTLVKADTGWFGFTKRVTKPVRCITSQGFGAGVIDVDGEYHGLNSYKYPGKRLDFDINELGIVNLGDYKNKVEVRNAVAECGNSVMGAYALLSNGTVVCKFRDQAQPIDGFENVVWIGRYKRKILGDSHLIAIHEDGAVSVKAYGNDESDYLRHWKLFDSYETIEAEREATRLRFCRESYTAQIESIKNELANLKGLFSGKRRKELETQLAQVEENLKNLK